MFRHFAFQLAVIIRNEHVRGRKFRSLPTKRLDRVSRATVAAYFSHSAAELSGKRLMQPVYAGWIKVVCFGHVGRLIRTETIIFASKVAEYRDRW